MRGANTGVAADSMLRNYQYWTLTAIAALCLVLVALNIVLVRSNQTLRTEVQARAQYIQQSIQLQGLYKEMVNALADLSVRNKDDQLRNLLGREGITVTVNPPATPAAPAVAPAGGMPRKH